MFVGIYFLYFAIVLASKYILRSFKKLHCNLFTFLLNFSLSQNFCLNLFYNIFSKNNFNFVFKILGLWGSLNTESV